MKKFLTLFLLLYTVSQAGAQLPPILWQKNYGGTNSDVATAVQQTSDGGFIVAGYTESNNTDVVGHISGQDYWVLKLTSTGAISWKKIYGGSSDDRCYAVRQTTDGGYILAGTSNSANGDVTGGLGAFDMWVVKLNSAGAITWKRNLGGSDDDAAYSVIQLADGGYVVAGESKSGDVSGTSNQGGYDYYIVRLRPNGNILWQRMYGGSSSESAKGVDVLANGNFCVAGETESNNGNVSNNQGGFDYWVLRLRPNGLLTWARTYGGTSNDKAYSIDGTSDGGMVVAGMAESNNGNVPGNNGGADYWVVKLSLAGNVTWSRNYGGLNADIAHSIRQTSDGGYIVGGSSESSSGDVAGNYGASDYWLVKLAGNGNLQSNKHLGGADNDVAYSVAQTADGGYIVAGASESDDNDVTSNYGNMDYWVVKLGNTLSASPSVVKSINSSIVLRTYPNPATNFLYLSSTAGAKMYSITNTAGVIMANGRITGNRIDITRLLSGNYFVTFVMEDGKKHTNSFIKQ